MTGVYRGSECKVWWNRVIVLDRTLLGDKRWCSDTLTSR